MPMLDFPFGIPNDETGLAGILLSQANTPAGAGRVVPKTGPSEAGGAVGNRGPVANFQERFSGEPAVTAAPALPPPIDVASAPVAARSNAVADPFGLGVGQTGTIEDVQLPQNATPTGGVTDQPAVPPASLLGRLGDALGRNSNTLVALGAGLAGAPSWGTGISRALTAAGPAQQADIKQQQLTATVQALMKRGLPQDAAMAAAGNPAVMAQLLPSIFGPKQMQFTQVGEDMLGNKRYGFVDPVNRKVYNLDGSDVAGGAGGGGGGMIPAGADGQPLSGQPLLKHLEQSDPIAAAGVKSIIAGNENAAGRNLQKLLPLAALIEPGFTQQTYQTRLALAKNYTSGKQFNEMQAINTVSGHLADMASAADKLKNFENLGPLNLPANMLREKYREMSQDPRVSDFNTVKQAVSNELSKAYRGGHVTEGDVREWQSNLNAVQTPEQLRTVIGRLNELLMSKRQALEEGWKQGMGMNPLPAEFRAESDRARSRFNAVADWSLGGTAPGGPAHATPAAGAPKNFQWTPDKGLQPIAPPSAAAPAAPVKPGNYQWTPDRGLVPVQ